MRTVTETLRDYYAASNNDDLPGMVSHYHEPVTFISASGVTSFARRAEAIPHLAQFFAPLRARGAVRTEWTESHIRELSETLAVADIGLVRFTVDGREVERLAFAYLLHKTATGWKIAVLASHPADTIMRVDG
jgi:ketosteroid isomerase-like protein